MVAGGGRRRRGVDLRRFGTGTVSGTALYRVAGFAPLAVAGSLDVAKGAIGPLAATPRRPGCSPPPPRRPSPATTGRRSSAAPEAVASPRPWAASSPVPRPVLPCSLGGLVAGRLRRQTGLGCFAAYLALVPVVRRVHGQSAALLAGAVLVPLLVKRIARQSPAARGGTSERSPPGCCSTTIPGDLE